MSIQSDRWIRKMATEHDMINPFLGEAGPRRRHLLRSVVLRIRPAGRRRVQDFYQREQHHRRSQEVRRALVRQRADPMSVIVPPNSFALARSVEYFKIPRDVLTICVGKSTYARCGIIVNVTPVRAGVGRVRHPRDLQHHAAAGAHLCQRRTVPDPVLPVRRGRARPATKTAKANIRAQKGIVLPKL